MTEKEIKNLIDLAAVYGWQKDLQRDRQINFRNEVNDLIVIYWSAKKDGFTISHKLRNKKNAIYRKGCDLEVVENTFKHNDSFDHVEKIKVSILDLMAIRKLLIDEGYSGANEPIQILDKYLPKIVWDPKDNSPSYSVTTSKDKVRILKNGEIEDEYLIAEVLAAVPIGNKTQLHYVRDGVQSSKIYDSEDVFHQITKVDVT